MPTDWMHKIIFAVPNTPSNEETMKRFGVATHGNYTPPQRLQIMNGTLAYDPEDPQTRNYLTRYSDTEGGSVITHIGGEDQQKASHWGFFQSQLAQFLNDIDGILYCRVAINGGETYKVRESNVPELDELTGQELTNYQILNLMGLYDWTPSG